MKLVSITCENNNVTKDYPAGTDLLTIACDMNIKPIGGVLGVYVNNKIQELNFNIISAAHVRYFGLESPDGQSAYNRTLFFVMYAAIVELFPKYKVTLEYPASSGFYCTAKYGRNILTPDEIKQVKEKMIQIIDADLPIERIDMPTEKAIQLFEKQGLCIKTKLLRSRETFYTSVYSIRNVVDYFYGYLTVSTGYVNVFDLFPFSKGMILSVPDEKTNFKTPKVFRHEEKVMQNFAAYNRWQESFKLDNIGELNEAIENGEISDVIKVTEANQEIRIHQAAEEINKKSKKVKIILLAGPSSSGKTTSAKRLILHLKVLGTQCHKISLDDYFFDRQFTPRDENGDYDFETIKAIDIKFFNQQLNDLLKGKEIRLPKFDFITGKRTITDETMKLNKNDMVIVEGIHGLNPELIQDVNPEYVYKIFVSALTTISIDGHNIIPSEDNRLIRRIVRDYQFRGYSAQETISRWQKVLLGERKYIDPFKENADYMFNSALLYELSVLKGYAIPLLLKVPEIKQEFSEAYRLIKFLNYFDSVGVDEIPPTSLMREFLGGSSFKY